MFSSEIETTKTTTVENSDTTNTKVETKKEETVVITRFELLL